MDFIKTQETLIKLLPLWQNKIARPTGGCDGCGKCAELCPVKNVTLQNGKPQWGANCTRCTACINGCPHGAIEYKNKTQGKERYYFGK